MVPAGTETETMTETCPCCLNAFKTLKGGRLARHGFRAHNVRHGEIGGFHTGSCPGAYPLGTEAGNAQGLRYAADLERVASETEAKPALTLADAERAAVVEALSTRLQAAIKRYDSEMVKTIQAEMRTKTGADFAQTSYRGWFSPDALACRLTRMTRARAEDVAARREFAAAIRAAVAANPAG
jgi:hypothetical protein